MEMRKIKDFKDFSSLIKNPRYLGLLKIRWDLFLIWLFSGNLLTVDKFRSRFIWSVSLLDRALGLIAKWNIEAYRRRFVRAIPFP